GRARGPVGARDRDLASRRARGRRGGALPARALHGATGLSAVEPLPPIAAVTLPWDAGEGPTDPVAGLAAARARHGDTFVVDGGDTRYLFLFSPAGVRAFYALPERQASKGLADCRMLLRKLPEELFAGRRTFAHDLFGNEEVEGYLEQLEQARRQGIAGDVVLLPLASMSNLFAAIGWTLVHLLQRPAALARVVAGDDAFLHCAAQESIRLAQRSIMLRAALTTVQVDDGTR